MAIQAAPIVDASSLEDFVRLRSAFCVVTLLVLASLLMLHIHFASILGEPSLPVVGILSLSLFLILVELLWLKRRGRKLTDREAKVESGISILVLFLLTASLTQITNRDENPYFVLLAIPILQCAFAFGMLATSLTIAAADAMIMGWIWHFFSLHPPARITQYLEGGMLCVVYLLMGLLVCFLVEQLKSRQLKLAKSLEVLQATRERLIIEEKLAAVGRLASGVAHELRNPVAIIANSLATAVHPGTEDSDRAEMFAIAARESKRLESLTADFLTYAKPSPLKRSPVLINDMLCYIASITKAHAASHSVSISAESPDEMIANIDASQVEGAVLNLVLNAIDATPAKGTVKLSAFLRGDTIRIDIEDNGPSISEGDLIQIFEPFFTTKSTGTGLGLAIARGAARAHGGDLWVSKNRDGCVMFSMTLGESALDGNVRSHLHG